MLVYSIPVIIQLYLPKSVLQMCVMVALYVVSHPERFAHRKCEQLMTPSKECGKLIILKRLDPDFLVYWFMKCVHNNRDTGMNGRTN